MDELFDPEKHFSESAVRFKRIRRCGSAGIGNQSRIICRKMSNMYKICTFLPGFRVILCFVQIDRTPIACYNIQIQQRDGLNRPQCACRRHFSELYRVRSSFEKWRNDGVLNTHRKNTGEIDIYFTRSGNFVTKKILNKNSQLYENFYKWN